MTMTVDSPATASRDMQPPAPLTLTDTGLTLDLVIQLVLKTLHVAGELSGIELADRLGLLFSAL